MVVFEKGEKKKRKETLERVWRDESCLDFVSRYIPKPTTTWSGG
jgi:hypothetical protein